MDTYDNAGFTYLGIAVKHPVVLYVGGRPMLTGGEDAVEQAILHRLNTPIGSLIYARDYGSQLHQLLFFPNNETLKALLFQYIKECVNKEERVVFQNCTISAEEEVCYCAINYRHKARNEVNSLIFPFYRTKN